MKYNIEQWPVTIKLPVNWGDMDAFAHVNNVQFIKWFESIRIEYFMKISDESLISCKKVGPILAHISANYLAPVVFPDTVLAATNISKIGNSSFTMEYLIHSQTQNKPVATGTGVIVMLDYETGEKVSVSQEMRDKISKIQGDVLSLLS